MTVNKEKFEMIAKTFLGLEEILADEIRELKGENIEILNRAVRFFGDKTTLYKANLYLRTAIRILIPVLNTKIDNQEELYDRVREFEWEKYIRLGNTIAVDSIVNDSVFDHSHFLSLRTKDAIADRFREKFRRRPSVNTDNPDILINVHLTNNQLDVSVDSSGESLHKRGYRVAEVAAPINEVLAAGLIKLAEWKGDSDFYDPMCGSGTIGIEAALIARHIPPGVFRQKFGFESHPDFDSELWVNIFDDIYEKTWDGQIFCSDISGKAVRMAMRNAKEAAVLKTINFSEQGFESYPEIKKGGVVIMNPPYGERLARSEIQNLYRMIGNVMKRSFSDTDFWIISSNQEALKSVGLKPSEKIKLYNGGLECRYIKYEMYKGSKKEKFPAND